MTTLQANPAAEQRERMARHLSQLAQNMQADIDHKEAPLSQRPTYRRITCKNNQRADAALLRQTQKALRLLARLHAENRVPAALAGLATKTAVHEVLHGYKRTWQRDRSRLILVERMEEAITPQEREAAAARAKQKKLEELEDEFRFQKIPGFFPTPRSVAERMIDAAEIEKGNWVLEPSAGLGHLADIINEKHPDCRLYVVEVRPKMCEVLRLKEYNTYCCDFLEPFASALYDRAIMNPPFEKGQALEHVQRAWNLLTDGGRLVALVPAPAVHKSPLKELIAAHGWYEELPADSFNGADAFKTTGVNVTMIVLEK